MDEEDKRTEKMADRFAAELLLPSEILNHMITQNNSKLLV
ncbi:MAG: ImmA/IrrE family metallo-endopeptidase [Ruminococcus sp.]